MKKILLLICFILLLTGCESIDHIEDTNGDSDYSLAQITTQDIIDKNRGISLISIITNSNNGGSVKIEKFSGVKKLVDITKKNKIIVSFELIKGNASLCIVTKDKIIHQFNINEDNQEFIINTTQKLYFKLAGESAKVNINYTIE